MTGFGVMFYLPWMKAFERWDGTTFYEVLPLVIFDDCMFEVPT